MQPTPPKVDVDFVPAPESAEPTSIFVPEPTTQTAVDSEPTATPEAVDTSASTPPPVTQEDNFAQPLSPTPRRQFFAKPTTAVRTSPNRPTALAVPGSGLAGILNGNPSAGMAWVTPHPSYPATLRSVSARGATTVRITTDASGRVLDVVIVQSAGNPARDAHTMSYVRENWRGPANSSRTTQFVYQLR